MREIEDHRAIGVPQSWLQENHPLTNMVMSKLLTSYMVYPRKVEDKKNFEAYTAKHFYGSIEHLKETFGYTEELAMEIYFVLVKERFKSYKEYKDILTNTRYPSQGKIGSIEALSDKGKFAGEVFKEIVTQKCGVRDAIDELVADGAYPECDVTQMAKEKVDGIEKNTWVRYKSVAHLWATVIDYGIPLTQDEYFDFEQAQSFGMNSANGLVGFVGRAMGYIYSAEQVVYNQSKESLVDSKTWRIAFV
ncbi:hypothetical protein [uncultured Pseudodesulfovibrio sp.]|uniref:hypothetical protein n=1 Tax=uncultured Pseudodesulfovibrio sp. TaxID=2035858 RepID=UPI0029C7ECF0|nr:hypothetical protein [uncultured Pseudodesulfovibrio sp.]